MSIYFFQKNKMDIIGQRWTTLDNVRLFTNCNKKKETPEGVSGYLERDIYYIRLVTLTLL